jgi:hypothetical protein
MTDQLWVQYSTKRINGEWDKITIMPQTITTIRYWTETGLFGYEISFEGRAPHHRLDTCDSKDWALLTCDPTRNSSGKT